METWHAAAAWLGETKDEIESDVLIAVEDGVIVGVTVDSDRSGATHTLAGIVIPGLVSAHSHAFHRALRGRREEATGDFWSWRSSMYELANKLTPETYRNLGAAVFGEMLLAGITTVGEFHYIHNDISGKPYGDQNAMGHALVEAAKSVGIRMTLIDSAYTTSDVTGSPVMQEQRRFADASMEHWISRVTRLVGDLRSEPLIKVGLAAHSVRGVRRSDLSLVVGVAKDLGCPLHIHVSEQVAENEQCLAEHGITPIELLDREGFLGTSTTLVHATHINDADISCIASSGSRVCLCPTTEAHLGDGIGRAIELSDAGVTLCVGSDSNTAIDVFEELRRVEHYDRLRLQRRGVHDMAALLAAGTSGGAESLGWMGGGRIAIGSPADFVAIDPFSVDLAGTDPTSVSGIVVAATRASVTDVVVHGSLVVSGGQLTHGPGCDERSVAFAALGMIAGEH